VPYPSHPHRPAARADPRAVARERLAERTRRVRTLRRRAAGGAVTVFLAAWLALFVPAERSGSATTPSASAAQSASATGTAAAETTAATDEAYDSGWADDSASADQGYSDGSVAAGAMTSGQS